jgi:hypothetical protein
MHCFYFQLSISAHLQIYFVSSKPEAISGNQTFTIYSIWLVRVPVAEAGGRVWDRTATHKSLFSNSEKNKNERGKN